MENVVLTVHLILALLLIGVVLLQRNEGGALLSSGGSIPARGAANALTRLTWIFAIAFIATSVGLTIISAANSTGGSVLDRTGTTAPAEGETPVGPTGDLLPPTPAAPATTAPAEGATPAPVETAPVTPPPAD